jgi:uncharacterized membrane protein YjgN (DUF898 family)
LIIIAAIIVFQIILTILPVVGLFLFIGLILLFPWLITRAMVFNARMSVSPTCALTLSVLTGGRR